MLNYVPIKHKQMSFVSNGGKFKLYTVLINVLINDNIEKLLLKIKKKTMHSVKKSGQLGCCLLLFPHSVASSVI
jgi:hypothetical protein